MICLTIGFIAGFVSGAEYNRLHGAQWEEIRKSAASGAVMLYRKVKGGPTPPKPEAPAPEASAA
jgi:hypothetical protein